MPWGDAGYLSSKLQKVGTSKSLAPESTPVTAQRVAGSPKADLPDRVQQFLGLTLGCSYPNPNSEPQSPSADLQDDQVARVKLITGKLRKFFFAQRSRVLQALDKFEPSTEYSPDILLNQLFDSSLENKELEQILTPLLTSSINHLTCAQLAETLSNGVAAGESRALLAARIKAVFNHASNDRAEPIALTQTRS